MGRKKNKCKIKPRDRELVVVWVTERNAAVFNPSVVVSTSACKICPVSRQ